MYSYSEIIFNNHLLSRAETRGFCIRSAKTEDFRGMANLMEQLFGFYTRQIFGKPGEGNFYITAVMCENNKNLILGAVAYTIVKKEQKLVLELDHMGVNPDFQRQHIGTYLLSAVLYHGKAVNCDIAEVISINNSSGFYEKFGFDGPKDLTKKKLHFNKDLKFPNKFFDKIPDPESDVIETNLQP